MSGWKRTISKLRKQYEQVYRSLSRVELQRGMSDLDELDVGDLFDSGSDLWLGFYTKEGIETALNRYGVLSDIRDRGFKKLEIELRMDDPDEHMLRIWSKLPSCKDPLLELVVSRGTLHFEEGLSDELESTYAPVLTVQWILMQNPMASFDEKRPPLPSQSHPGLGVGAQVMTILANACRRLNLAGLVTIPAHFHNALLYGVSFKYINPDSEGTFRALSDQLLDDAGLSLPAASWAMHWNMVTDRKSEHTKPFEWFHEAMLWPIGEPFTSYFDSREYKAEVQKQKKRHRFEVFESALQRNLANRGLVPWDQAKVDAWLSEQG